MPKGQATREVVKELIIKQARRTPRPTNRAISDQVKQRLGETVSEATIRRICRSAGLSTSSTGTGGRIADSDRRRLSRLLDQMWIPDPLSVTGELSGFHEGLNVATVENREFLFRGIRETTAKFRKRLRIDRCWHPAEDEKWLLEVFAEKLTRTDAGEFRSTYGSLQKRTCRLVSGMHQWNFFREFGDGRPRLRDYEDLRMSGTVFPQSDELAAEALFLIDETPGIRAGIAEFAAKTLALAGA